MNYCFGTHIILESFPYEKFWPPQGFEPTTFLISIKLEYELSIEYQMPTNEKKQKHNVYIGGMTPQL